MSSEPETAPIWRLCAYDGCPRAEYARGWCVQHWGRVFDGRPVDDPQRRPDGRCAHDDCDRKTLNRKAPYCRLHDYRDLHGLRMSGAPGWPELRPAPITKDNCPRCEFAPWSRGRCARHYTEAWKAGELTDKHGTRLGPLEPAECNVCHETKRIKSRGLCSRCHMAATRLGTLEAVADPPRRVRREHATGSR